jgi:hypothetical protein
MRNTLLATAASIGLALAMPAMAQTARQPLPANPSTVSDGTPAAGTDTGAAPGQDPVARTNVPGGENSGSVSTPNNTTTNGVMTQPQAQMTPPASGSSAAPMAPASGQASATDQSGDQSSTASSQPAEGTHNNAMHRTHRMMNANGSGHWAHQPGSGESGPASSQASNIDSSDTHSRIAPHFPNPPGGENAGPVNYLHDAERALSRHRTGEADQALEMAETRLLDRSTPATEASAADQSPAIEQVTRARKALASGDMRGAREAINTALASAGEGGGMGMGHESGSMGNGSMGGGTGSTGMSSSNASGGMAPANGASGNVAGAAGPQGNAPAAPQAPIAGQTIGAGTGGGPVGTPTSDSAGGAK